MPELPEVQTVVSDLNKKIKGDVIVGFWSDWGKTIKNKTIKEFTKEISGKKILGARRIGKNIFIDLSGGKTLYIHLKMTGHLLVKRTMTNDQETRNKSYFSDRVNQYVHHVWKLQTENYKLKTLEFSDLRKFGKIVLVDTDKLMELKEIKELGIDAMSPKFTFEHFNNILEKKKQKKIRDILMDQNLIAGIGNIYLSEISFDAGILPERLAKNLKPAERKKIYNSIQKILKLAIKLRGTSDSDYRDTAGAPGGFQKVLKVYRKEKQKCPKCDTIIRRLKMGQRSVFVCPVCQK
jgi:formamidopyrimidine-DNA glycosylase